VGGGRVKGFEWEMPELEFVRVAITITTVGGCGLGFHNNSKHSYHTRKAVLLEETQVSQP